MISSDLFWFNAVAIAALVIGASACAPAPEAAPEPDPHAEKLARIEVDLVPGIVIEGMPAAPATLAERMEHFGVPALSVAMWSDGEIVWARAWGMADVENGREATPETLFQAASISKPVAAMGLLALVDEGAIDLEQNVNELLTSWNVPENELTEKTPVTLRGLLSHTAGTTVHGFPGYAREGEIPSTIGVLDGEGNTDPIRVDIEPRTEMRYSGGGYTVAQLLASDVTGAAFADLMRDKVLEPLRMSASTYEQPLPESRWGEAAIAYRGDGSVVDGSWHVYPEMAAAGLWTTPSDLARFAMSIQTALAGEAHPVLSAETLARMLEPQLGEGYGLGLGLPVDGAFFGHGGSNEGFRCNLMAEMDGRSGIAIMTNSDRGGALGREFLITVAREEGWEAFKPQVKTVVDLPQARLEGLVGRYSTEGPPGAVEIYLEDSDIWARSEWDGQSSRFYAESETHLFDADDGMRIEVVWDGKAATALKAGGLDFQRVESSDQ
jgi:CubicO group peptidase (beta-lactamase class C family)